MADRIEFTYGTEFFKALYDVDQDGVVLTPEQGRERLQQLVTAQNTLAGATIPGTNLKKDSADYEADLHMDADEVLLQVVAGFDPEIVALFRQIRKWYS